MTTSDPKALYLMGTKVLCATFLGRTEQGTYNYRFRLEDGEVIEQDVDEGFMIDITHSPHLACDPDRGPPPANSLPEDDATRNEYPMFDGLLAYFPNALAEVARVSKIGNDQHNPGEPMHWARGKSTDHLNKVIRHITDAGKRDKRGVRHTARAAWRILAELQEEIERDEGVPLARGARL